MRVLFATYPWAFAVPGGGERQIEHYAAQLPALGVEVVLHDPWKPRFDDVDAVHYFSVVGGSVHFCNFVHQRGLALIVSSSLWVPEGRESDYPLAEISDQLRLADVIIPNSAREAQRLAEVMGISGERFAPVLNGVDARFAKPADGSLFRNHFGIDAPFVLNVGNVEARKNQITLARALADTGLPLVIIGQVREHGYAERLFAEAGPRLRFLGPLDHADPLLASAYAACSVFALPSMLETPGLAALEAAAAGAPLVVTREGAAPEYFDDDARYVDPHDPADIARGIAAALADGRQPALARLVRERYFWPTVLAPLPGLYRQAVERAAARKMERDDASLGGERPR